MNAHAETAAANTALIQSIYQAFGRGDVAFIAARVTPDTHWSFAVQSSPVPRHQPVQGPEGVAAFLGAFVANVTISAFEPRQFVAAGDEVMVHVSISFKINRTGKMVTEDQIHWWTLHGGKVAGLRHFEDSAQVISAWAA